MNRFLWIVFALILFSLPATGFAQAKTLEELMEEVDEDVEATATNGATAAQVKTLEELMGEVAQDGDTFEAIAAPEVKDDVVESPDDQHAEAQEAPGLGAMFWIGLIVLIVGLILLGVPLYVLIGSISAYLLFVGGVFTEFRLLTAIIEQTRGLADQPVLLAIPFFVMSGAIMTEGDIARRLIAFAEALFGWMPGGLAISAVFACVFFAAISGSSPVTVIAIGSIMYPALVTAGYPERFSSGLVTSGGSLGILIPPSIPMIVYAIVDPTGLKDPLGYSLASTGGGDAGVKDLFIAGLGPGLLIGLVFAAWSFKTGLAHKVQTTPFNLKKVGTTFVDGFWALNLPIIILGGIYSGVFTPTQAAAVSVVYAALVEFFIHRSIKLPDVPRIFSESAILMGSLLIIMALALGFNLYLDRAKIPEQAVDFILSMDLSVLAFLLIVNILLIIVGFFMDILSAILILVPLLAPVAFGLGIHPLHMAIIFIVNLEIGYLTPPIGLNLFVASSLFKKGIGEIVKSVAPFVALMAACLLLITYVPSISLGLVSLSRGGSLYVPWADTTTAETAATPETTSPEPDDAPTPDKVEAPSGVKSLDELMGEVDDEEPESDPASEEPQKVKTLEELMNEVE
ncbi:MAG: TRAP transporter large permease [bacterium]